MKKFALTGHPLAHSLSPFIHSRLMSEAGIVGEYALLDISPADLHRSVHELLAMDGFNVTIPSKTLIIPFLSSLSDKAALFGAVNTVDVKTRVGYNTDCIGFNRAIDMAEMKCRGRTVICGAGGVGRMIAFECAAKSDDVTVAVRESSLKRANELKNEIKAKINKDINVSLVCELQGEIDLLINGTPAGMFPDVDTMALSPDVVEKCKNVFDTVYNPSPTLLLKTAAKAGANVSDGMAMLVCQAAAAQEIWNGCTFSEECILSIIEDARKELNKA